MGRAGTQTHIQKKKEDWIFTSARMEEDRWPGAQGDRGRAVGSGRHCRSCNAKITRWRRSVDGNGNDGWGEKLSRWEVAKEPIRHLASLTHSLAREKKERREKQREKGVEGWASGP